MSSSSSSSSAKPTYNANNPAIKRLLSELRELQRDPSIELTAHPLDDNLFEWHFTIRGPSGTEFEGGRYHGRIILPNDYPFKPPSIVLLTPNGRFEINKKICLSITGYHPEYWQPAWGIRTALMALISFFPTKAEGAIAGLDWTEEERKRLARSSLDWSCPVCGSRMRGCLQRDVVAAAEESSTPSSPATAAANRTAAQAIDLSMFKLAYAPQTPTTEAAAAPLKEESTSSETAATGPETQPAVAATQQSPDSTIRHRQTTTQPNATTATRTTVQLGSNSNINNNNRGRLLDALIAVIIFILGILIIRRILIWLYPAYMYFNSNL